MTFQSAIFAAVVLVVALAFFWKPSQEEHPAKRISDALPTVIVTDLAGHELSFHRPIKRVILMRSLCLPDVATLLGDDLEDILVGWDSSLQTGDRDCYDKFLKRYPKLKEVAVLGDVLRDTVSVEAVIALQPDLVILNTYMLESGGKTLQQMERAGLPLLYLNFDDPLHDPQRSLLLLGKVFGKEARAETVVQWVDGRIQNVLGRLKQITGPIPSIYLEAGTRGLDGYGNTFGSNGKQRSVNWASLLKQLRCRNIASRSVTGPYGMGVIEPEQLLTENPDVIVITGAHWTAFPASLRLGYDADRMESRQLLQQFTKRPGWSHLDAVKNQRVFGIQTRFGSHLTSFAAAEQLSKWLFPEEFADLQPEADLREFHKKFLPIELSGTWMISLKDDHEAGR